MTGSALLAGGDRLAPGRHRSLAAAVEWSYRLLGEQERRVFRAVSVFPGPFTLEAAEAVAGPGAGPAVLRLVDCSLLVPPRTGPGWPVPVRDAGDAARLRGRAAGRGRGAGRRPPPRWPGRRWGWPSRPRRGCRPVEGEVAAARWLDAEDATMRQVLAWAMEHDPAGRAAAGGRAGAGGGCCGAGWPASTRCCARPPGAPSRAATGGAPRSSGSARRRGSRLIWPGRWAISPRSATPSRSRGPSRALADCPGRPVGGIAEPGPAPRGGRGGPPRPGLARELGYPAGEALALEQPQPSPP